MSRKRTAVLFDRVPLDIKARHETSPRASRINGGHVFYADAVKAILQYSSSFDEFWFLRSVAHYDVTIGDIRATVRLTPEIWTDKAIRFITPDAIPRALHDTCALLMTSTENPGVLIPLRQASGRLIPITAHLCAADEEWLIKPLMSLLFGRFADCDAMICPSEASRTALIRLVRNVYAIGSDREPLDVPTFQTPIVPIGIDPSEFQQPRSIDSKLALTIKPTSTVILYFGRFYMYGKADLGPLLLAFTTLLAEREEELLLVFAGADPNESLTSALASYAEELGCRDRVAIYPNPNDETKQRLLGAADIFVSLSDTVKESFGISVLEAMASGVPVVCSHWNGYREIVVDGETGFLIPTAWTDIGPALEVLTAFGLNRDSTLAAITVVDPEVLVTRLRYLVQYPERRRAMGEAARQRALSHYAWPRIVERYEAIWATLQERARARAEPSTWNCSSHLQTIFDHYPTTHLSHTDVIHITAHGIEWRKRRLSLGIEHKAVFPIFIDDIFQDILMGLSPGTGVPFGQLLTSTADRLGIPEWFAAIHASRLLKYGFCELRGPRRHAETSSPAASNTESSPQFDMG
jgi:D-inositol-3-phosphate glycosyltransferase